MPATPTNFISLTIDNAKTILSNSATFQGWTGLGTPALARARISAFKRNAETITRPNCLVGFETISNDGGPDTFTALRDVTLFFRFRADAVGDDPEDEGIAFLNQIGGIWKDLETLAGTNGLLAINSITMGDIDMEKSPRSMRKIDKTTANSFFTAEISVTI